MQRAVGVSLGIYLLSYLAISPFGAYAPAVWGTNGVKWYAWAPPGFYSVTADRWRVPLCLFYFPLSTLDNRWWHTHAKYPESGDPTYPPVFPR